MLNGRPGIRPPASLFLIHHSAFIIQHFRTRPPMPMDNTLIPIVIEKSGRGERAYDIYSRLLKDRIIMLTGPVTDESAAAIQAQLLFLSNDDPKSDINFYINSPGGSVSAGFGIVEPM